MVFISQSLECLKQYWEG